MFSAYKNIWFCGLAASGKTTLLKLLHQSLGDSVDYCNDSLEMVDFIRQDIEQNHHYKPTPDSFVLKDSEPVDYSVRQLIKKVDQSDRRKVIEISRGLDTEKVVNFSYEYLFSQLPESLQKNSLFVYIYSPLDDRRKRNSQRPALSKAVTVFESFFCPKEAFERFFTQDDFLEALKNYPVNVLFIPNTDSLNSLEEKVKKLFLEVSVE